MVWLKKLARWITTPYHRWQEKKLLQKRLEELRRRDPFIYK
jgi:hypothetical protein